MERIIHNEKEKNKYDSALKKVFKGSDIFKLATQGINRKREGTTSR